MQRRSVNETKYFIEIKYSEQIRVQVLEYKKMSEETKPLYTCSQFLLNKYRHHIILKKEKE